MSISLAKPWYISWEMKGLLTMYWSAWRTSFMERGFSSPSGAGAGLVMTEIMVAGAWYTVMSALSSRRWAAGILRPKMYISIAPASSSLEAMSTSKALKLMVSVAGPGRSWGGA